VLAILAVIAKQERVRLSERTLAGLAKARKQGRVGGRPKMVVRRDQVEALRAKGLSITEISEKMEIPRTSVHRILKEFAA
jgi:DNA invertase Pin-like site-specific DNA recombinase